jgi:hypothetical protein
VCIFDSLQGISLAARAVSARSVGAAQCKKQDVGDVAETEQIDAPGQYTVRIRHQPEQPLRWLLCAGARLVQQVSGPAGLDLQLASSSGGRL